MAGRRCFLAANVLDAIDETCITASSNGCTSAEAGSGAATQYKYEDSGHPYASTSTQKRLGGSWLTISSTTYDSDGRVQVQSDALNQSTAITYGTGLQSPFPSRITNALSQHDDFVYDSNTGNITQHIGPNMDVTNSTYDVVGRPVTIQRAAGVAAVESWTQFSYPNPTTVQIADDKDTPRDGVLVKMIKSDGLGRTISQLNPSGASVERIYSPRGNLQAVSNPLYSSDQNPSYTSYLYDALNRNVKTCNSDNDSGSATQMCTANS